MDDKELVRMQMYSKEAVAARNLLESTYMKIVNDMDGKIAFFPDNATAGINEWPYLVDCWNVGQMSYKSAALLPVNKKNWLISFGTRETENPRYVKDSEIIVRDITKEYNQKNKDKDYLASTLESLICSNGYCALESLASGRITANRVKHDEHNMSRGIAKRLLGSIRSDSFLENGGYPCEIESSSIYQWWPSVDYQEKFAKAVEESIIAKSNDEPF